jgi:hypothetical protein
MQYSIILLLLAAVSACKTQVLDLQHHPSFTHQSATNAVFVAAGVVSNDKKMDVMQSIRYGDLLARSFSRTRPYLHVIRTGMVIREIGVESFRELLSVYRLTGVINKHEVADVQNSFPQARYLMFSRIEKNKVSRHHSETETDVADSAEDRKEKEYEHVRVDVSLDSRRDMEANLMIYDLQQDFTVWSGYVEKSDTNSNRSSRTFSKKNRWKEELADAFIDALIGLDSGEYPEFPSEPEVLEQIFEGFAENMPEPPKR